MVAVYIKSCSVPCVDCWHRFPDLNCWVKEHRCIQGFDSFYQEPPLHVFRVNHHLSEFAGDPSQALDSACQCKSLST